MYILYTHKNTYIHIERDLCIYLHIYIYTYIKRDTRYKDRSFIPYINQIYMLVYVD